MVSSERRAEIDKYVEDKAKHETKAFGFRLDSNGGENVGEALKGNSELGKLSPAERDYLAREAVKVWNAQTDDRGGQRENIEEAADRVKDDPAARKALAAALIEQPASTDRHIENGGTIATAEGGVEAIGHKFEVAASLDLDAVVKAYKGNEVGLAKRIANSSECVKNDMWEKLSEPGRLPAESQQALTASLFFLDKTAAQDGMQGRRENIAEAIALMRRPGDSPADVSARSMIASNIAAVMETGDGRDMLLNPDKSAGSRLWALNEIASVNGCINPAAYAGLDAPALKDAPGKPDDKPTDGAPSEGEVIADVAQMALDIVGIADPTGIADGANALISLFRGDVGGALISAAGIVPYVGDLAKAGKLGKWAKTMDNVVDLAGRSEKFMDAVKPYLEKISGAIKGISDDVMNALPGPVQDTLRSVGKKIDDALQAAARRAPLVLDDAVGQTKTVNGRTLTVGDGPVVNRRADGGLELTKLDGQTVKVIEPQSGITRKVENADGSVTYTKNGRDLTYDADGFPVFDSKADVYIDASHINSRNDRAHFTAANEKVKAALDADPSMAEKMGLTPDQVEFFKNGKGFNNPPPDLTWHHHQDTGKMQLVDRSVHDDFKHTGGMAAWGGGRN